MVALLNPKQIVVSTGSEFDYFSSLLLKHESRQVSYCREAMNSNLNEQFGLARSSLEPFYYCMCQQTAKAF